jgi:hypothetical protein
LPAAIPQGGSGGGGVNYFFNFINLDFCFVDIILYIVS